MQPGFPLCWDPGLCSPASVAMPAAMAQTKRAMKALKPKPKRALKVVKDKLVKPTKTAASTRKAPPQKRSAVPKKKTNQKGAVPCKTKSTAPSSRKAPVAQRRAPVPREGRTARTIPGSFLAEELQGDRMLASYRAEDAGPPTEVDGGVLRDLGGGKKVLVPDPLTAAERAWLVAEFRKRVKDRDQKILSDGRRYHWGRPWERPENDLHFQS